MYLSAERLALANQEVKDNFEQACVAWQTIPHWDTGDPGQTVVRSDVTSLAQTVPPTQPSPNPLGAAPIPITPLSVPFQVTLAQAMSPTPDALLAAVISRTVYLANAVDDKVLGDLKAAAQPPPEDNKNASTAKLQTAFINARVEAEKYGYRAPSCLLTNTAGLTRLSLLDSGNSILEPLLAAANANSLHRVDKLADSDKAFFIFLARRQRIAHAGAATASPGEEPVDIAVSVPPSLQIIGETSTGNVELAVRISFAPRIKDKYGVVGVKSIP
ncbi:hypothetical protein ABGB19_21195 [Mycobacterium sp. B14F4]|uniref:hypothetical protein n=1 Tax=Mycobacterium sp. B14F4 TaxID=3153565 RepID=UPI00325C4FD6